MQAEVTGTKEVAAMLHNLPFEIRDKILREALGEAAHRVKVKMVSEAPESEHGVKYSTKSKKGKSHLSHEKGNLKRSIAIRESRAGGDFPTFFIGPDKQHGVDAYYAAWIERGHYSRTAETMNARGKIKKGSGVVFVKPNPFIRRTYDALDSPLRAFLTARIKEKLK